VVALAAAGVLLAAACSSAGSPSPASPTTSSSGTHPTTPSSPSVTVLPASLLRFGSYHAVPLADPAHPAYQGPATPTSLSGVRISADLQPVLKLPGVSQTLTRQGFVVVPDDLTQLHFGYQGASYQGWPVYVTTDAAYHVWHLTFDAILRTTEEQALLPKLRSLVEQTLPAAHAQSTQLAGTSLAETASRAEQLYQVAAAELGVPVALGPLAGQEKALVDAHAGAATSPILGVKIDYSLFTPRGHYTRSAALKRYFVAMSVLGQSAFCLPGTQDCDATDADRPTRVGLLASRALLGSAQRVALWQAVYEPTAFLVGLSDDYTPGELDAAARAARPGWPTDPAAIADHAGVAAVVAQLKRTRTVRIDPEKASVRLMGTRFVLDSFIMDQLTYPGVGENAAGQQRLLPTALDVATALGSAKARQLLTDSGAMGYRGYPQQLDLLGSQVAQRPAADWGGTVYDAWLAALQPVLATHGSADPPVMRTDAWAAKDLQSGLGSYAQLKHDTILYTKQAVAEGGDEASKQPVRNWVEPEPVAYARLAAALDLMRTGLTQRNLISAEQAQLATDVSDLFGFFARTATDELAGKAIAKADDQRLTFIGEVFEALWFRTSDHTDSETTSDLDAALIADIASGPDRVLEIGTGRFDRILVLVPDDAGRFQLASGAVFSYYEFTTPAGQRLTDQTWRTQLDNGAAPARPSWQQVLLPH
jgi:hypothetical protein